MIECENSFAVQSPAIHLLEQDESLKLHRRITSLALLALLAASVIADVARAEPVTRVLLRPDLPYQAKRSDPVSHEVEFAVVVTPPYHCQVLKVWLPIPPSNQGQEVSPSEFSTFPMVVAPQIDQEPLYGNRFAYFEFHHPQGAQIICHKFTAKVWNLNWNVEADQVSAVTKWPENFASYLQPQAVENEAQLAGLLRELVPRRTNAARDLGKVFHWIDRNLTYDHVTASLQADANHALAFRRGHCSDYHGLCATMGRVLGYPTRVTYGLSLFPKNSPSHCKMEAFLPPYGWVSFDLSETQKLVQKIVKDDALSDHEKASLTQAAQARLAKGFRENSWLLMTQGTDYDLVPAASHRVNVVRTAYVEADGQPLPEPDPANSEKREFAWMTSHRYQADRPFTKFQDLSTLSTKVEK